MILVQVGVCNPSITCIDSTVSGDEVIWISTDDTSGGFEQGTMSHEDTSWSLSDLVERCPYSMMDSIPDFEWIDKLSNAQKATDMMITLGRMYEPPKHVNHHREAFTSYKRMFAKSGKLPKRIRRIRK